MLPGEEPSRVGGHGIIRWRSFRERCRLLGAFISAIYENARSNKTNVSDKGFVGSIETILSDEAAPADMKHRVLQLAIVFACSINQLSPGAYLLRKNFFPPLVKVRPLKWNLETSLTVSFL